MSAVTVNWTGSGNSAISENGYLIHRSSKGGYMVFDPNDQYCGSAATREAAEELIP